MNTNVYSHKNLLRVLKLKIFAFFFLYCLGENVGKKTSAHFVLSGSVRMLQKLVLRKKGGKYELDSDQQSDSRPKDGNNVQCVYMQLSMFTKGGCFGLGTSCSYRMLFLSSLMFMHIILLTPRFAICSLTHERTVEWWVQAHISRDCSK